MKDISPLAGKFVRVYVNFEKTECLQPRAVDGYDNTPRVADENNNRNIPTTRDQWGMGDMNQVGATACDPNIMYYVLPDGNADSKTGLFALWGYDKSTKTTLGPLMTDAAKPFTDDWSWGLRAVQVFNWGASKIPYFSWSVGESSITDSQFDATKKRKDQYGDNSKWFKWYPQYYYKGTGGTGNSQDPSRFMSVYLWSYDTSVGKLTGALTQNFYDKYYSNEPKSKDISASVGTFSVCRSETGCQATGAYMLRGNDCSKPCQYDFKSERYKYYYWVDVNGKKPCGPSPGSGGENVFQDLNDHIKTCFSYSGWYYGNGGAMLTPLAATATDYQHIKDYSSYTSVEEVPRDQNPLYIDDMAPDICSPESLASISWESSCPFQQVRGVGGPNLDGREIIIPETLEGMPFLKTLRVLANRDGFGSARISFHQPDGGGSYKDVFTGPTPVTPYTLAEYSCTLDTLEIITELELLPKLVGDIPRRTIYGLRWKTNRNNVCSIPSEWKDDETVWQSALKFSGDDLGGGIPVGLVYNQVTEDVPLDPFSAKKGFLGHFGLVFYRKIASGLSNGGFSEDQLNNITQQLDITSQQVQSAAQVCSFDPTSPDGKQTCEINSTQTAFTENKYTEAYSYSASDSSAQSVKVAQKKPYGVTAKFKTLIFSATGKGSSEWTPTKTTTMESKQEVNENTEQNSQSISSQKTELSSKCGTTVTVTPQKPEIITVFVQTSGEFEVDWAGNYSLVLEGGAVFNFTGKGIYAGKTASTCYVSQQIGYAPPTPPPPPKYCPRGDANCFCSDRGLGYYPDYSSGCKDYYKCFQSTSAYESCPQGEIFDASKESCEPTSTVTCVKPMANPMVVARRSKAKKMCKSERSSCYDQKKHKDKCDCPNGKECLAKLTYKSGLVFRCQTPRTNGRLYPADIVEVEGATCKNFVTINLKAWPNLKSVADRCNIPEWCLWQTNKDLLKAYATSDGTFLSKMKGRRMNIGCFHPSNYS